MPAPKTPSMTPDADSDTGAAPRRAVSRTSLQRRKPRRSGASDHEAHWFEIPGRLVREEGVIRLREPPASDISGILEAIRSGTYAKPFVVDDGMTRRLHFDFRSVQSEMSLAAPDELLFAYTREMMAFLLLAPKPRHVVIVGLGGGSLTKFCYRQLPRARVTTIEIDDAVIGLSELFEVPAPDRRLRLLHADAADYFATGDADADVVLIDGCDRWGTAATFCEPAFYRDVRRRLRPGGIVVLNLIGLKNRIDAAVQTVAEVFDGQHAVVNVRVGGNRLLFAFNADGGCIDWRDVRRQAEALRTLHGLDFPAFARRLQRAFVS
jgi:spermidine synthase